MKITEIEYERLFSLGQYENERITLHADVNETENPFEVFKDIKATVFQLHEEGKILEESKKVAEAEEPKEAKKPTQEEINSLKSMEKVSDKGPYQLITKAENPDNPAFETLRSYIKQKNGFCQIHGFKAWIFSNDPENKIGLRKK